MKDENIFYEYDNSEMERMKELGKIKDDSAVEEMKRQVEQEYQDAREAMQQMKEQGMILEKDANDEVSFGRSR